MKHHLPPEGFARRPQVLAATGFSKSTLRRRMLAGDFPKPVALGPRIVGWDVAAVRGWIVARTGAV
ncbi:AlpA family phage regulatory protein [Variovorax robiniae]|uniref:AlpA family phage regulatory protein n=1 Tax=Variovorax robiniae TaxID=1836199 RepID=A0ABU8X985_9BURK